MTTRGAVGLLALSSVLYAAPASGHCDGMDGPVVKAAQEALARGDVTLALIWVRQDDEAEVRSAFDRCTSVRALGSQAQELADRYFFETVVRLHRAGEGAAFSGLKPAGRDLGLAIPAADRALQSGDLAPLTQRIVDQVRTGLLERYKETMTAKDFESQDLDGGREYVKKYVTFIHYVEGLSRAVTSPIVGHDLDGAEGLHHEH